MLATMGPRRRAELTTPTAPDGVQAVTSAVGSPALAGKTHIGALCRPTRISQPLLVVNDNSARRIEDFVSAACGRPRVAPQVRSAVDDPPFECGGDGPGAVEVLEMAVTMYPARCR
jgi:hypothetical protein